MPILPPPIISNELLGAIERAELMCRCTIENTPGTFIDDGKELPLVAGLYSLSREHFSAILYLLRAGQFDGSAFALARPLVEAVYKATWLYSCAKDRTIKRIRSGEQCYPSLPDMADLVEERMQSEGIFSYIVPIIKSLHGYTHGGIEQLGRRFDQHGNVRPNYPDEEKIELIELVTRVFVMLAIAYPQLVANNSEGDDPDAKAISKRYVELYPGGRGRGGYSREQS